MTHSRLGPHSVIHHSALAGPGREPRSPMSRAWPSTCFTSQMPRMCEDWPRGYRIIQYLYSLPLGGIAPGVNNSKTHCSNTAEDALQRTHTEIWGNVVSEAKQTEVVEYRSIPYA